MLWVPLKSKTFMLWVPLKSLLELLCYEYLSSHNLDFYAMSISQVITWTFMLWVPLKSLLELLSYEYLSSHYLNFYADNFQICSSGGLKSWIIYLLHNINPKIVTILNCRPKRSQFIQVMDWNLNINYSYLATIDIEKYVPPGGTGWILGVGLGSVIHPLLRRVAKVWLV